MRIIVASTLAEGPTRQDAVNRALQALGLPAIIARQQSETIPADSFVYRAARNAAAREPLKAIHSSGRIATLANKVEERPGRSAWAGLGWAVHAATGQGRFARWRASGRRSIVLGLHQALERWCASRMGSFEPIQTEVIGGVCQSQPICALVVAVVDDRQWLSIRSRMGPGHVTIHADPSPAERGVL